MILATTTVEDVDRFLKVFGTTGADKRATHGSKGSTVFRDPTEENRMWVLFEWDEGHRPWPLTRAEPRVTVVPGAEKTGVLVRLNDSARN